MDATHHTKQQSGKKHLVKIFQQKHDFVGGVMFDGWLEV